MWIDTCFRCPLRRDREDNRCKILAEKVESVRGLGLTKIAFRCERRQTLFSPGSVVEFSRTEWGFDPHYGERERRITCHGIVMRTKGRKVLIYSEDIERPVSWWYPDKIHATGERVRTCIHCGRPEGKEFKVKDSLGNEEDWLCSEFHEDGDRIVSDCDFQGDAA